MYYVHWVWEMLATYLLSVANVQRGKALRCEAFVCLTDRLTDGPTDCYLFAGSWLVDAMRLLSNIYSLTVSVCHWVQPPLCYCLL